MLSTEEELEKELRVVIKTLQAFLFLHLEMVSHLCFIQGKAALQF